MYLADVFTVGANLAGVPAITVPCGFTDANLPVGLQFTARKMDEATLLQVAGGVPARDRLARAAAVRCRQMAPADR